MKPYIVKMIEYFEIELPKLKKNYNWKIPKIDGFDKSGYSDYDSNIELKKFLCKKWETAITEQRTSISSVIVKDWGGVKNNKIETLQNYVKEIESRNPKTPLKGVASYSKIFSITDLSKYAIYDARVAACLNAVQWNSGTEGLAFNYISGRNNVTGHSSKKIGFVYQDTFTIENLVKSKWGKIEPDNTYAIYLDTLRECLLELKEYQLYDLEMVLFANAEEECKKAMGI